MRYIIIFVLLTSLSVSKIDSDFLFYGELLGPTESFIAPNIEYNLVHGSLFDLNADLNLRAGISLIGSSIISDDYQRYISGIHYIIGDYHKIDLGIDILYQRVPKDYIFRTDEFISFNIGYRNFLDENRFIGFAINPTFSEKNKPFFPASIKFGMIIN